MAENKPYLNREEQADAEEHTSVRAHVIHEAIRRDGEVELRRPASALGWSGLAAGLSMGFSLIAEALLRAHLPDAPWRPLIVKLGYPLGFLVVILGKQQLYTENTLTAVLPLMSRRDLPTLFKMLKLWAIVLLANLTGAHIIAWVLAVSVALKPEIREAVTQIGREAAAVDFATALLRGVFAGWLIALVVWLRAAVLHGHILIIIALTYFVALGSFTHVVVGSIEVLYLVMTGQAGYMEFFAGYMIPSLIGNTLGGVALVSALNHAQVISGEHIYEEGAPEIILEESDRD